MKGYALCSYLVEHLKNKGNGTGMMKLILASGSPRRRELMRRCGLEFNLIKVDVDESYASGQPQEIVEMLSKRKAEAAEAFLREGYGEQSRSGDGCIIICADTMVAADGEILGKPKDREDAGRMLRLLQGRTHQVYTGVTLVKISDGLGHMITFSEKTDVIVRTMAEEEIAAYVETGECDDKAGAYAIQGSFSSYIQGVAGDYDNVVGLPMKRLSMELRKLDYPAPMPIHMVVTDIDGTLVKDSSPEVYPEMIDAIRKLRKMGILFCIATGRQYYSVRHMFQEVADDIIYLCENGAHVVYNGQDLHIKEMKGDIVRELLGELRQFGGRFGLVISTPKGCYLEHPGEDFETLIRESYHNKYQLTDDFLKEGVPCIKMAIYQKGSIRAFGEGDIIPRWKDRVKTCMAGEEWVDFMDAHVDKGEALQFLQEYFGINKEETMVFGDNANDIGMLTAGGESYAVENAREEVREKAKYICPGYQKKGVYSVIDGRLLNG